MARFRNQIVCSERRSRKAPDRDEGTVDGQGRNNDIHTGAIGQARVHHRRRFIDAPSDGGNDLVDNVHQVCVVLEDDVGSLQHAAAFHIDYVVGVHQDVVDTRILQQWFERAEAEQLIKNFLTYAITVCGAERCTLLGNQLLDDGHELALAASIVLHDAKLLEVDALDELVMYGGFELMGHAGYDRF